jgi:hypothetical protein
LVESYGTWLLFQRLDDASKDSDIPKNVPFAFAINTRNINSSCLQGQVLFWGGGSPLHSGIEFGQSRTSEGSSGGRRGG